MAEYEYTVIPAPTKGVKAKGKRSAEDRFCHALELRINEMARDGWEYQRAEILPSIERSGLTSSKTTWHNLLVFRRRKPAVVPENLDTPPARVAVAETPRSPQDEDAAQGSRDAMTVEEPAKVSDADIPPAIAEDTITGRS